MNMFERMFGGPKDVVVEMHPKEQEVVEVVPQSKTIEDIKEAKGEIASLQEKRQEVLEKHRDTVQELRDLGVNEFNPDTAPRTKTVNEILNPIEEELAMISGEITEKREEFDLQPKRLEVLDVRMKRLEDLKARAETTFLNTSVGADIDTWNKKIGELEMEASKLQKEYAKPEVYKPLIEEASQLREKRRYAFVNDKVAGAHADLIFRIDRLRADVSSTRYDAASTGYDDNGHNRI